MFINVIIVRFAVLSLFWFQSVKAKLRITTKVCPIIGPSFPKPSNLNSSNLFQDAVNGLDRQIDFSLKHGTSDDGNAHYNQTTFSIGMFSIHDEGLIYQRHNTDPSVAESSVGVNSVDADTIYRIGSISKLMTAYLFLILGGERRFNDPITDYIPELAAATQSKYAAHGVLPKWDEITIEDLATHSAGLYKDYALDDIEFFGSYRGLPPLPESRIPDCGYQIGPRYYPCTKKKFLERMSILPALFAAAATPSYSNAGYDLFGMIIENMSGVPLEQSFNESLVKALNLTGSYYTVPNDTSFGAIPVSELRSGWNQELGPANPDGGNFMSTNDLAIIGKAIMSSALLPKSVTRRWMKPRTFTGDPKTPVGAPWEIYRWETPLRIYDMYTKEGEIGNYATMIVLVPDLGLGFGVQSVGSGSHAGAMETLANIVTAAVVPAVENVARQQADQNFSGRYFNSKFNSSVVITTDDQLGLKVTEWISNGTNLLKQLGETTDSHYVDFRLWPNELYSGTKLGFTASWETLPRDVDRGSLPEQCQTWLDTGDTQYGNVALGGFVFDLDKGSGEASHLSLPAFPITLARESDGKSCLAV